MNNEATQTNPSEAQLSVSTCEHILEAVSHIEQAKTDLDAIVRSAQNGESVSLDGAIEILRKATKSIDAGALSLASGHAQNQPTL